MIKVFYDTETTGVNYKQNSIHQLSGYVDINNEIVEEFNFRIRPHQKAKIDPVALKIANVTEEQIMKYPFAEDVLECFEGVLGRYVNRYESGDKIHLVGYNNRSFDDHFLRMMFELCGNRFFNAWFWSDTIDVMVLASFYLRNRRSRMPSFKLSRVALELGIEIDESKLHDSMYDVELTRKIYRIVTGIEVEM